ncbi:hypothetical protein Q4I30_003581, partial [Leishmania utingensis]
MQLDVRHRRRLLDHQLLVNL